MVFDDVYWRSHSVVESRVPTLLISKEVAKEIMKAVGERILILPSVGLVLFLCVFANAERLSVQRPSKVEALRLPDALNVLHSPYQYEGTRSCAASACHGQNVSRRSFGTLRGSEYSYWLDNDPHAQAFRVLASAEAEQIVRNLSKAHDGPVVPAIENSQCLRCHSPLALAQRRGERFYANDGVGCEACHGPAQKWLASHRYRDWSDIDARESGMANTKNLLVRAAICVQCHVGSDDAEVNHDLIAAGHPPLKFELSSYHRLLPKHWDESRERQRVPDLDLRLWVAGQLACSRAAVELLNSRAERAMAKRSAAVWPELAEYDCYACHRDLASLSGQRDRSGAPFRSRGLPWGSWYYKAMSIGDARHADMFSELREIMQERSMPDLQEVRRQTAQILAAMSQIEESSAPLFDFADVSSNPRHRSSTTSDHSILVPFLTGFHPEGNLSWDDATQAYLFLVAANAASRPVQNLGVTMSAGDMHDELTQLRRQLAFPPNYMSPQTFYLRRIHRDDAAGESTPEARIRRLLNHVLPRFSELPAVSEPEPGHLPPPPADS